MMKKNVFFFVVVSFLAFLFFMPTSSFSADGLNMRLTTDTPDTMPQGEMATWFGEEVMRRLPGSAVKVFNASSLYNNTDSLEAMHAGTLEACWASLSKISAVLPQGLCLRLPTLFSSYDDAKAIPTTAVAEYIEKSAEERGYICLGWGILSPYMGVGAREGRILMVEDWKGKKIRCYDKVAQVLMVEIAGGSPVAMPWGEFVPSAQSGVVDAGFTSLSSWSKVKEVLPYFSCVGIVPDYYIFLVAKRWWNGLPETTRKVVAEVADEACAKQREMQFKSDMKLLDELAAKKTSDPGVYVLSGDELTPYRKIWIDKLRARIIEKIGKGGKEALDLAVSVSEQLGNK